MISIQIKLQNIQLCIPVLIGKRKLFREVCSAALQADKKKLSMWMQIDPVTLEETRLRNSPS
jgi:hypothetical protein